jgi:hypothetical protein
MQFDGDNNYQSTSEGGAGSEPQSVRTARPRRRSSNSNVTGLFNSDISHRVIRPRVSKMVIERYQTDVKIHFQNGFKRPGLVRGGKRENIYQLSDKSVRNLKFVLRNVMHLMDSISTVTYPYDFEVGCQ